MGPHRRRAGRVEPDLTFSYDAAGRLLGAGIGDRSATVEYDALDRATRVVVDGETQLEEGYRADEVDAATREDRRTGGVLVAGSVSPVYGTMESVVYTRPRSTEFGIVAYSPSLKTYAIRLDALAADGLLLAGLRSRMAPLDGDDPNPAPFGHDKPSNGLFIPPEFRSVNCQLCNGAVFQIYLTVTPAPVHCATQYRAVVDGFCQTILTPGDHAPISFGVPVPWLHATVFGDGASSVQSSTSGQVDGSHAYIVADTYTMSHSVLCSCPSAFAAGTASRTFAVPAGNLCTPPRCTLDIDLEPDAPTISVTPAMPSILATAKNVVPSDATIAWSARISHNAGRRCWGGPIFSAEAEGAGRSFEPHFGFGNIYGGELVISARCSAPGYESSTVRHSVTVKGTQPTDAVIVAEIGSMESPFDGADLRRIACYESSLTQFLGGTGMPYYGGKDDVGIMQICWDRRLEHLWNWRTNVARGKETLEGMMDPAKDWLDSEVEENDDATPYTNDMWRKEAIHRYNAGDGDIEDAYWEWQDGDGWVPIEQGGTKGYVGHILAQSASCR